MISVIDSGFIPVHLSCRHALPQLYGAEEKMGQTKKNELAYFTSSSHLPVPYMIAPFRTGRLEPFIVSYEFMIRDVPEMYLKEKVSAKTIRDEHG